jgi:hypothetical protein
MEEWLAFIAELQAHVDAEKARGAYDAAKHEWDAKKKAADDADKAASDAHSAEGAAKRRQHDEIESWRANHWDFPNFIDHNGTPPVPGDSPLRPTSLDLELDDLGRDFEARSLQYQAIGELSAALGLITGFTRHGLERAIMKDGVGVTERAMLDTVKEPVKTVWQLGPKGWTMKYVGKNAVVVLNEHGQVVSTRAISRAAFRVVPKAR